MTESEKVTRHRGARRTMYFLIVALVLMLAALGALVWVGLTIFPGGRDPVEVSVSGGVSMEPGQPIYGFGRDAASQFRRPHDVAVGPDGDVYVADLGNGRVVRVEPDGTLVGTFGSGLWGAGRIDSPTGVAVGPDGRVYVADTGARGPHGKLVILSPDLSKIDKEVFYKPGDAPIMTRIYGDKLYVASIGGVHVHSLEGDELNSWGGFGRADGQFSYPNGIALLPDGTIVIAESNNKRLQFFDPRGKFLKAVGEPPGSSTDRSGLFGLPMGIAADDRGILYLCDAFDYEIKILGPDGAPFASVGQYGSSSGQFDAPGGITRAGPGRFWVADELNNRVVPLTIEVPEEIMPDGVWPASEKPATDLSGLVTGSTCLWILPVLLLLVLTVFVVVRRVAARRSEGDEGESEGSG